MECLVSSRSRVLAFFWIFCYFTYLNSTVISFCGIVNVWKKHSFPLTTLRSVPALGEQHLCFVHFSEQSSLEKVSWTSIWGVVLNPRFVSLLFSPLHLWVLSVRLGTALTFLWMRQENPDAAFFDRAVLQTLLRKRTKSLQNVETIVRCDLSLEGKWSSLFPPRDQSVWERCASQPCISVADCGSSEWTQTPVLLREFFG